MATISLRGVRKSFGPIDVVNGINLDINDQEFVAVVGPSGCGKTTLLRLIAGLERIDAGELRLGGAVANDVPPSKRSVSMVFQNHALYPHMDVAENLAFGLRIARVPRAERYRRVRDVAAIMRIEHLLDRSPSTLSGGERQRVAIGRAIVVSPDILLFDEPLSNLDAALRTEMRIELAKLRERLNATVVYVTHDQVEALALADRVVVLREGVIEQVAAPMTLYENPANVFVARFMGSPRMNLMESQIVAIDSRGVTVCLGKPEHTLSLHLEAAEAGVGDVVTLGVRAEHLAIDPNGLIRGETVLVERLGNDAYAYVQTDRDDVVAVRIGGNATVDMHQSTGVHLEPNDCHLFDRMGQAFRRAKTAH